MTIYLSRRRLPHMRTPVFVILSIAVMARAGVIDVGGPCSSMNDHLDPESRKFISECTDQTFCSRALNGTCAPRLCRRDEYPFGFNATQEIPPQCDVGSYCPDEGSGCVPLEVVGSPCQLNRDEQCGPPPDWERLASSRNFNGSICLQSTCMYANKTLSQSCIIENTTFHDVGPDGQEYVIAVMRDNCLSHRLYCDPIELVCQRTRSVGLACTSDFECEKNCGESATCTDPPETPLRIAPWQWVMTVFCVLAAMTATCILLTLLHQRHQFEYHKELREYYFEQLSLRRSIIALHTTAAGLYVEGKRGR